MKNVMDKVLGELEEEIEDRRIKGRGKKVGPFSKKKGRETDSPTEEKSE